MSIITTVEAVPNRMRDIFNYVAESKKPIQRDNLRALFMPPSKRRNESTAVFDSTLKECLNIGLLIDDDGLQVSEYARKSSKRDFKDLMYDFLFNVDHAKKCGHEKFLYSMAWLMTRTPAIPLSFSDPITVQLQNSLGSKQDLTEITGSKTTLHNLYYWSWFLGLGEIFGATEKNDTGRLFMPNPCIILEDKLNEIFQSDQVLRINEFIKRIGEIIPVLDGGVIRVEIEKVLTDQSKTENNSVSKTLSYAIKQLEFKKLIELEKRADAKGLILNYGEELRSQSVSEIRRCA